MSRSDHEAAFGPASRDVSTALGTSKRTGPILLQLYRVVWAFVRRCWRSPLLAITCNTSLRVAILVSPGVVIARAPCAAAGGAMGDPG